jgi:hypothetical protein
VWGGKMSLKRKLGANERVIVREVYKKPSIEGHNCVWKYRLFAMIELCEDGNKGTPMYCHDEYCFEVGYSGEDVHEWSHCEKCKFDFCDICSETHEC